MYRRYIRQHFQYVNKLATRLRTLKSKSIFFKERFICEANEAQIRVQDHQKGVEIVYFMGKCRGAHFCTNTQNFNSIITFELKESNNTLLCIEATK